MDQPLDILVFSPHPDDAELGCAGSLILAVEKGLRVGIADLSRGELASRGTPEQRNREAKKASETMGLGVRLSVDLPDSEIGNDPAHRLAVVQILRETRPRLVLAPYWKDRHPDHAAAGRLVREAFFFSGVKKLGAGHPHKPDKIFYYMLHCPFIPSFVVDITSVWLRKLAVLEAYASQFQSGGADPETALSQPEFLRFVEARSIWFGAMIGVKFGEPFYSPGPVPLGELPLMCGQSSTGGNFPPFNLYT
ncbi:MAG: bacillithiol biosynthesis deacetylase BshB1 [Deltaproteobacteria bacterium]|nr:bacillithiol biosynthesis deacetylase BshB1 [Deltaproteobacteria bacterium]